MAVASVRAKAAAGYLQQLETGRWDPHDVNMLATASDTSVNLWDLRVMKQVQALDQIHAMQVRDIDYNPKKQYTMMTTGDDSRIRFWDLRSTGMPLRELPGHSHWTWRARYNPFYDELVLSAGTDTVVNLWSVPSIAASKGTEKEGEKPNPESPSSPFGSPRGPLDGIAQAYTEHEDSVYGIAWSAKDPWVFASLSYDGRVVVDVVPVQIRKKLKG
ncbi:hypothetical protein CBR_g17938 [Chara braunii]|uniref:EIPR1-like beta-propeller domain-containing protein n=1 Tax=Chara braunii TaxID=69332 RepID=A0A388KVZ0_CHABU|nr:hypothetical protein CBR_g17938 [Chara braunii]|eukprot:GBG74226.1 hypothetical protein CBR_g17938 [Chara braunii]